MADLCLSSIIHYTHPYHPPVHIGGYLPHPYHGGLLPMLVLFVMAAAVMIGVEWMRHSTQSNPLKLKDITQ